MKIGLFFGSFNPIHLGHTRLASYVLEHTDLEQIWLVISPNNPLKDPGSLLPEDLRFRLAETALRGMPNIIPCDREFSLPKPNYTVNTLRALSAEHPDDTFTLIIGSDNMALFDCWREHDYILSHYPIIVYPREGDDMHVLHQRYPEMQVIDAPLLPISATDIRRLLRQGDTSSWLDPNVAKQLQDFKEHYAD